MFISQISNRIVFRGCDTTTNTYYNDDNDQDSFWDDAEKLIPTSEDADTFVKTINSNEEVNEVKDAVVSTFIPQFIPASQIKEMPEKERNEAELQNALNANSVLYSGNPIGIVNWIRASVS